MPTSEQIFEAAATIRYYLPDLEPERAASLDQQIADLLNQDRSTPGLDNQLLRLITQIDTTRTWTKQFLNPDSKTTERGLFSSTNDPVNFIDLPKYACPHGDYIWYRHGVGDPIPHCPTHGIPLERVTPTR
ncbi:MAG: hypothetical protein F6K42_28795 [Leptolyngbya sp. SIO1D8]|nr:hypothetical protein [Leptolyngbya sp. SIO1D8]